MRPFPDHIWNDPIFQLFLEKKNFRESTARRNASVLNSFCTFVDKNPTEIHDLHKVDLDNNVPEYRMWLSEALDNYVSYLIKEGKSKSTIKANLVNIKGFFHAFRLKPTPTVQINLADDNQDYKYQLSREDIQKAIKNSNPTYQAIFTVQAQTGLAISDALQLDVKDFIDAVTKNGEKLTVNEAIHRVKKDKEITGCFDMRRKKTSNDFYTFVSREALLSIALLLESKSEEDLTPDSPIFMKDLTRVRYLNDNYIGNLKIEDKKKLFKQDELRLNVSAVEAYTSRMHLERDVFKTIMVNGKRKSYFTTHKLRKWYSNQLRFKVGFNMQDTKYLMGQTTGDVFERYANPNNYNFLKEKYTQALPHLAINETIKLELIENSEELTRLRIEKDQEIEQLNEQMALQEARHQKEIAEMNSRMDSVESNEGMSGIAQFVKEFKGLSGHTSLNSVDTKPIIDMMDLALKKALNNQK